jgi:hypothetical protein
MAELGDYPNFEASPVEIEWLDYEYVKNCTDIKKLKSILSVLKSGKEGIYVDVSQKNVVIMLVELLLYFVYET